MCVLVFVFHSAVRIEVADRLAERQPTLYSFENTGHGLPTGTALCDERAIICGRGFRRIFCSRVIVSRFADCAPCRPCFCWKQCTSSGCVGMGRKEAVCRGFISWCAWALVGILEIFMCHFGNTRRVKEQIDVIDTRLSKRSYLSRYAYTGSSTSQYLL